MHFVPNLIDKFYGKSFTDESLLKFKILPWNLSIKMLRILIFSLLFLISMETIC